MRMRVVAFRVPERELLMLDMLVARGLYRNRSEAIRAAIRRLLEDVAQGRV
jgi:Arc/MetJ-type ribon-helix-helix transcriptional regulator